MEVVLDFDNFLLLVFTIMVISWFGGCLFSKLID